MSYNYYFEIASAAILAILIYDMWDKKRLFRWESKLFCATLAAQLCLSGVDFISCILVENGDVVPLWMNRLFCVLYFMLQAVAQAMYVYFIIYYVKHELSKKEPAVIVGSVFFLINFTLSLLSAFWPIYFKLDDAANYSHGALRELGYYFYMFNMLLVCLFVLSNKQRLLRRECTIIIMGSVFVIAGTAFQYAFHYSLTIGIVSAFALLFAYITLENPNDYIDRQTGCSNEAALQVLLKQWNPETDVETVLFLDLSRFHYVKSLFGSEAEEMLLREVTEFLQNDLGEGQIFRLERNLFALVISGTQEQMECYEKRISQRLEQEWELQDGSITCMDKAMVICQYPVHFSDYKSLTDLRDYLFDYAKYHVEQRAVYADDALLERCRRREEVEVILQNAITDKTLEVFYQPIYDRKAGKVYALEALARLYDDKLGYIGPDEFIAIAEENGSILSMGVLVFEKVCNFIHYRLLPMENCPVEKIEVNLSPLQCMHSKTIREFKSIMMKYKIPPRMINFEITESATTDSPELLKKTMQELLDFGVSFSLDDYGTGYSNITYLVHFPFDYIKFDKQLVWSYFSDATAHAIMKKEFELICVLQKEIIVEGIEDFEQYKNLSSRGIRYFQGYYFSKPAPEDECLAYLSRPLPQCLDLA